jgi:hypothetical protein
MKPVERPCEKLAPWVALPNAPVDSSVGDEAMLGQRSGACKDPF